jgi:TetR/AcrR family transcriptional repressor of nem operon
VNDASSTAAEILRCARALIITGGYNGFSYADISKVVGIRKASIHHHFPSKAELVRILVAQYRKEAETGLAAMEQHIPDPFEQLRAYISYWEACITDVTAPICVCALLASQIPVLPEEVAAEVRAHFRMLSGWLSRLLARGKEEGSIGLDQAPEIEAEALMATIHGAMLSARAYGDAAVFGAIAPSLLGRLSAR